MLSSTRIYAAHDTERSMKLYYSPSACSLASNIALREAGVAFDAVKVDLRAKKTQAGEDFQTINPKGYVPALRLENSEILTENVAVLQYIGDQNPAAKLVPPAGAMERYRLAEWLGFINSEVHKAHAVFFNPNAGEDTKQISRNAIARRYEWLQGVLSQREFLMGSQFTVADAYLYTVLRWAQLAGLDLAKWPALMDYAERIAARPHVQEALAMEGVTQK
jgi:glutathione S-transferase